MVKVVKHFSESEIKAGYAKRKAEDGSDIFVCVFRPIAFIDEQKMKNYVGGNRARYPQPEPAEKKSESKSNGPGNGGNSSDN